MIYFLFFSFGASLASFLVVVAERMPIKLSLVQPSSHCFHCQAPLRVQDLIPIVSYIRLKGQCFFCQTNFSPLSFIAEFLLGCLFSLFLYLDVWQFQYFSFFVLLLSALLLSVTDLLYLIIEPRIFYPSTIIMALTLLSPYTFLTIHLEGSLLMFLLLSLLNVGKDRLGKGDIKLLMMWTFFLGFNAGIKIVFFASLLALIFSFILILLKKPFQRKIPFVPFLSTGLLIYILWEFFL